MTLVSIGGGFRFVDFDDDTDEGDVDNLSP